MGSWVILPIAACLGLIPAIIAASKGRNFFAWWFYGTMLWIVAMIHSLVIAPTGAAIDNKAIAAGNLKCPHCYEWIRREAKVCRFCGRDVERHGDDVPEEFREPVVWPYPFPPPSVMEAEQEENGDDADQPASAGDDPAPRPTVS